MLSEYVAYSLREILVHTGMCCMLFMFFVPTVFVDTYWKGARVYYEIRYSIVT